jgi:hypothetical protein
MAQQLLGAKIPKRSIPHRVSERNASVLNGALLGFAIGVGMVIVTRGDMGISALWFLAAATTVGSLTGLDLYLTRNWSHFGRFTPVLRFTVACTGAVGLISAAAVLLGSISPRVAWSFTAFGAIGGLLYGIYVFGTSA